MREQIRKAIRSGADNQNCDASASQILLVLDSPVHRKEDLKALLFGK